ncbi:Peptidoglycan/LPS O-acetylase OafA/YrhL, contains acyltransferase and SGNH-hydrolase domains [Tessaracoccus bendigoensis DSM 12906]|uniref:Peptidoglycan/LPS O-acetylase OafA/YrhL, contains acyltransferase and SGNH-hydrolase domains n=1 Tax=Tessaracoccus bendigoensis DSM 12906 TaxID=1123357 RepID=A0A1M6MN46_9ACTN|nr:acyltransferase family protein [Tessaracoccus bendigoensis]SHJ84854.1 Peptidoglycan/LPS O-acetylase OafA/YrhL, contains acyltransferase and SGNH-hydrolase domains [Tessaracoccus bendigoensis DSM 12906]
MEAAEKGNYIASLDGLRTIAVGLVIAFHLAVPGLGAGFAGVDVFFVLSGYLITAGLISDSNRFGRPRLARFWQRRFRRLLPAASLLLLAVLVHASFALPVYRRVGVSEDAMWTVIYLANWHFMQANTYFSSDGMSSPLLHMWSLAVEEQFYFAWPLAIALACVILRRRSNVTKPLVILAGVAALASVIALAVLYDPTAADRAYMGTDTKAFEPLIGASLALLLSMPRVRQAAADRYRILATLGALVAIITLPFLAGPSGFYFYGGALLLSLGVVAVIAALVCGPPSALSQFLAWAPMAYLGRISYGLYLWHWPWAMWMGLSHGAFKAGPAVVALCGTVATAVVSYHFVEQPIRHGRAVSGLTAPRFVAAVLGSMAVILAAAGTLRATQGFVPERQWMVVTGDSVPLKLMSSLDAAAKEQGWALDNAARGGCTPLAVELQEYREPDHEGPGDCRALSAIQDDLIERHDPEIVFWWSRYETHQRWFQGRLLVPEQEEFWIVLEAEVRESVDRLTREGATLLIAQPERPGIGLLAKCPVGDRACFPLDDYALNRDEYRRRWNRIIERIAADDPRVRTFRMDPLLCNGPEPTEPRKPAACDDHQGNGRLLREDGIHVTLDPFGPPTAEAVVREVLRSYRS